MLKHLWHRLLACVFTTTVPQRPIVHSHFIYHCEKSAPEQHRWSRQLLDRSQLIDSTRPTSDQLPLTSQRYTHPETML